MSDTLTQLGVGGLLAYLLIKEILSFLTKRGIVSEPRGDNGKSGDKSPSYWREEIRRSVKEGLDEAFAHRNEELRRLIKDEISRWIKP